MSVAYEQALLGLPEGTGVWKGRGDGELALTSQEFEFRPSGPCSSPLIELSVLASRRGTGNERQMKTN